MIIFQGIRSLHIYFCQIFQLVRLFQRVRLFRIQSFFKYDTQNVGLLLDKKIEIAKFLVLNHLNLSP